MSDTIVIGADEIKITIGLYIMKKIKIDEQDVGFYFWIKARWLHKAAFFILRRVIRHLPFIEVYNSYQQEVLADNVYRLNQHPKFKFSPPHAGIAIKKNISLD